MAKTRAQKEEIVATLTQALQSPSTVFVHFTQLTAEEEKVLRRHMRSQGLRYYVAKKTLLRKAWEAQKPEGEAPSLEGEIAIAYGGDDPTAPARELYTFVKKYKDKLSIVGGVYEGAFKDAAEMNEVATIPPLEILRGMLVNVINSPIQGLVVALNQIAEQKND